MKKIMSKLILMGIVGIFLSGCSILPRVTFDRPNTVPQKTEKSEKQVRCSGQILYDVTGKFLGCSKGYSSNEKFYNQQERKLTHWEKFLNFLSALRGFAIPIAIFLLFFAPGILLFIVGRLFEGIFGISRKALEGSTRAINRAKKNGGKFLEELGKEHNKNKDVKKIINSIRAKIDE